MRNIARALNLAVVGALLTAGVVSADSPHYVQADFSAYEGTITTLSVNFHVAGLGKKTPVTAKIEGDYQVTVTCINRGSQNTAPVGLQGPKVRTANQTQVYGDKTGQYVGTLTLTSTPPLCPRGMDYDLSSFVVDWTDLTASLLDGQGNALDTFAIVYP